MAAADRLKTIELQPHTQACGVWKSPALEAFDMSARSSASLALSVCIICADEGRLSLQS